MKKLIVLLLAIAMVGAAYAQVTTSVSLSGSVYLENVGATIDPTKTTVGVPVSSLSPNGASYDVLTLSAADKDGKFGAEVIDYDLFKTANLNVDYWDAWYKYDLAKVTLGNLNGGSFVQYFTNGWLGNHAPTDSMSGNGILVESDKLVQNLNVGVFLPLTGAKTLDTLKKASIGASYSIPKVVTLKSQVNLDLTKSATAVKATIANIGFQYIGVKNLNVYGWGEYQMKGQAGSSDYTVFGVGGEYKTSLYRAGAEVEGTTDDSNGFAWDVIANARYYVTPAFFVQIRPDYQLYAFPDSDASTATVGYPQGKLRVRGYANYAFGNGLAVEGMIGYDSAADDGTWTQGAAYVAKNKPVNGIIHYIKLSYSISF